MDQVIVFILSSTKVLPLFLFHLPNVGLVVRTYVAMEIYKYISTTNTEKGRDTGLVNILRELYQRVCLQLYIKALQKHLVFGQNN